MNVFFRAGGNQICDWIDNDVVRLKFFNELVNAQQVHLYTVLRRTPSSMHQKTFFYPRFKIDAYSFHVSRNLVHGFFETDVKATFASPTGGLGESGGQNRLTRARCATDEDAGAAEIAFSLQHIVQIRNSRGNPLI